MVPTGNLHVKNQPPLSNSLIFPWFFRGIKWPTNHTAATKEVGDQTLTEDYFNYDPHNNTIIKICPII